MQALDPKVKIHHASLQVARTVAGSLLCAALLGCCGANDPNCKDQRIGPSGAEVAGIAIGIGAVATTAIVLGVHHAHHTLKGCVVDAPGGLQLHSKGGKGTYLLAGSMDSIKAGDLISVHGEEEKDGRGTTAIPRFRVEHVNKDYGACKITP